MLSIPAPMRTAEQLRAPFTKPGLAVQIKFDGYRCMAGLECAPAMSPQTRLQLPPRLWSGGRLLQDCRPKAVSDKMAPGDLDTQEATTHTGERMLR